MTDLSPETILMLNDLLHKSYTVEQIAKLGADTVENLEATIHGAGYCVMERPCLVKTETRDLLATYAQLAELAASRAAEKAEN